MSRWRRFASGRWRAATRICLSMRKSSRSVPAGGWSANASWSRTRVHESGRREIIGLDVGEAESEAFWREFLRGLVKRGLTGVQLAISDAHPGLKNAHGPGARLSVAALHRPFPAGCLGHARRDQHGLLGGADPADLRTPTSGEQARQRLWATRLASWSARCPRSRRCSSRPRRTSWPSMPSPPTTGASCARRTRSSASTARSAGAPTSSASSPTTNRSIRLVSMLAIEANDEWLVGRCYVSLESMGSLLEQRPHPPTDEEVLELSAA